MSVLAWILASGLAMAGWRCRQGFSHGMLVRDPRSDAVVSEEARIRFSPNDLFRRTIGPHRRAPPHRRTH